MRTMCAVKALAALAATASFFGQALAAAPEFHVTGALESAQGAKLVLTDKRPPQRSPKVPTAQGELDRFDEKNFDQPPIEALKHALGEQLSESTLATLGGGLDLTALDIAIGEKRGRRINFEPNNDSQINGRVVSTPQEAVGLALGNAIAGALLQSAADRDGSRLVFVNLSLDKQGTPISCQGAGSFSSDGVVMGWHAAIREAAARCAKLMGSSEPLNDPLPNRVR